MLHATDTFLIGLESPTGECHCGGVHYERLGEVFNTV